MIVRSVSAVLVATGNVARAVNVVTATDQSHAIVEEVVAEIETGREADRENVNVRGIGVYSLFSPTFSSNLSEFLQPGFRIFCRSRSRDRRRSSRDRDRRRRSRSRPRVIDHRDRRSPMRRSPPPRSRRFQGDFKAII